MHTVQMIRAKQCDNAISIWIKHSTMNCVMINQNPIHSFFYKTITISSQNFC